MSRQVRMARSVGRPSRRKKLPGMRPAAYMRSSTSTVRGKKSMPSRMLRAALAVTRTGLAQAGDDGALALEGQLARLERQGLVGARHGRRHDDGICHRSLLLSGGICATGYRGGEASSQSAAPSGLWERATD